MATIEMHRIAGADVYGVEQYAYAVDGVENRDYSAALAAAAFKQAAAVEAELDALTVMVRARQQKLNDLNNVLTTVVRALATVDTEGDEGASEKSDKIDALRDAKELARTYQITIRLVGDDDNQITYGDGQTAMAEIKHSSDLESNAMQQDVVTLQNLISKRDSTYQTLISLVKRSLNASTTTIKGLGQ